MNKSAFVRKPENHPDALFGIDAYPTDRHKNVQDQVEDTIIASRITDHPSLDEITSGIEAREVNAESGERFAQIYGDVATLAPISFSPINNLKSIFLSLEWEISQDLLGKLEMELNSLQTIYCNERTVLVFLRMLLLLERHIKARAGDVDIASIKLLFSIYDDFERIILSKTMPDDMKQSFLAADIEIYRNWAEHPDHAADAGSDDEHYIMAALTKAYSFIPETIPSDEVAVKRSGHRIENAAPEAGKTVNIVEHHDVLARMLVEFKKKIHTEFEELRMEIRMCRSLKAHRQSEDHDL